MSGLLKVKDELANGKILYGTHVFCGALPLTECLSQIGFNLIWIDMEHTAIGIESLQNNLIAARAGGTPAIVRIPWNDKVLAKPVLDMGPDGIIFPNIRSAEEARAAIAACEYPLKGERGYGPLRALSYYGISKTDYVDYIYREAWRFLQIEDIDAVNNLEEIVRVDGVDGYIVGPNDLAASVGHIGRPSHPDLIPIYDRIGEVMRKHGKLFGVSLDFDPIVVSGWLNRGAKIIFSGSDVGYVYNGASNLLNRLKQLSN